MITDEKYVSLTTYKRDGTTKSTPVWITDFGDGTIGFTTASSSHKIKRINNDPRVILEPSDSRGKVKDGAKKVTGTATTADGADFARYEAMVKAKYGMQFRFIKLLGKFMKLIGRGSGLDTAVLITLD